MNDLGKSMDDLANKLKQVDNEYIKLNLNFIDDLYQINLLNKTKF